ncbi:isocitrate lyase/PEP mutase family protein [Natronosalvus caseinilyticus]|uniref:isocitrate lyase/PEP mutase family protein n=1 Tax=Natronosalvus caseinilyticus TaxID=2953747 RepID=UPI0028A93A0A|nr:isocitrate lyase/PEP mutase family protein [Natronosalvus caseinilyticus]
MSETSKSNAQQLREAILSEDLVVAPGAVDALTATIATDVGFDTVYLGGYATGAATAVTEPMATMTEMSDRAREITYAVDVPLVVDGNAGFGDPAHTHRTVNHFINSGIAGMHIEDQVYPKRLHYHEGRHHITDIDSMKTKIEVADRARRDADGDIVLIARSDANRGNRRESETIEDAVNRVNEYLGAGAEVGMLFPRTWEEMEYVADHAEGPMTFVLSDNYDPRPTTEELEELGYGMVIYPTAAPVVITKHMKALYENIRDNGETGWNPEEYGDLRTYIEEIIGLPDYYDIEAASGKK